MGVIITNMELFILFIVFIILIETTILLFKHRRPNLNPSKQKFYADPETDPRQDLPRKTEPFSQLDQPENHRDQRHPVHDIFTHVHEKPPN